MDFVSNIGPIASRSRAIVAGPSVVSDRVYDRTDKRYNFLGHETGDGGRLAAFLRRRRAGAAASYAGCHLLHNDWKAVCFTV